MGFELILQLFERVNFGGQYRYIHKDTPDLRLEGFDNNTSSLKIYKGPLYKEGYYVKICEHPNCSGIAGFENLWPGEYPNINALPYEFGDKISSIKFLFKGPDDHETNVESPPDPSKAIPVISKIPLIVTVYEGIEFSGQSRTLLLSEPDFRYIGFDDTTTSLKVERGPNSSFVGASFYEFEQYEGGMLQPGKLTPGQSITDLSKGPYLFNNRISSLQIVRM